MLHNSSRQNASLHPPFPLWAYLHQPVFNPYCKTIWHPQKFAYQHRVSYLNICWYQEIIQALERCWCQEYQSTFSNEAQSTIDLPTSST